MTDRPDGPDDLFAAVQLSASSPAGATITGGAGGIVTFKAATQGTYTFTYRAQDKSLSTSATTGRVTVTVTAPESVAINRNDYIVKDAALTVEGTTNSTGTPTVTVEFLNSAGTVLGVAGTTSASAGKWKLSTAIILPVGATRIRATTQAGAVSPSVAITLK